ncbi:Lar family restriction alleviation protein [Butyricicoccus pullicaecorum]|nr:Lar family restriction alleviation protein [Butyricicoccus pullicaecorum]
MDEIRRALLGDKAAQDALTERYELLPCPFCGSEAHLFVQNGVRVICPKCDASSKILADGRGPRGGTGNATKAVVRAWNTRAPILSAEEMEMLEGTE